MKTTEKRRVSSRKYYQEHKEYYRTYGQNYYRAARLQVLSHYSDGMPKCAACGLTDIDILCVDHIDGGGNKHREELFGNPHCCGNTFYCWLKKNKFPVGYQILCYNCNAKKTLQGRRK